ncbi:trehalose synthase [Halalkalicoccus paucihalophilus]|uniref:Trehalose synthase n=1 Tax=Halalkalicoccus paucihalophilus TaxID=1008153 RepID=A0A151ABG6_9EURY|nr:glycosyltransferase [Halalkalicoccus paucihalophilus]KYH24900.1 trehalose synthase [Halalkalicoccus paucihalophilus]
MEILILSGQLGSGGAPRVCYQLVRNFPDEINVTVAYLGGRDELVKQFEREDISVKRLSDNPLSIPAVQALNQHLREEHYDLIHTHMISAGVIGRPLSKFRSIPVVHTVHTNYQMRPTKAKIPDVCTAPFEDVAVCVSKSVKESLPWYYISGKKIIHNCIDVNVVQREGDVRWDDVNWTSDIDEESPLVANVARYDPKKRRIDLIEAFKYVIKEVPDAQLVLTGRRGDRQRRLEKRTRQLGISENVFFVGFVDNPKSVYHHSDIIVHSSESEGFSIGMLEGMCFRKPIVATDIPAFQEALGPRHPFVPTRDPPALANRIIQYVKSEEKARSDGEQARKRVESHFSGSAAADKYVEIYKEVIEN